MTEVKRFQKNVENFTCNHCGSEISGNGYTNHCSHCLWSKHVDNNPGDRAATCGGSMEPCAVNLENGEYVITHSCKNCGHKKRNKVSSEDDFDKVVDIATSVAKDVSTGSVARAPLGAGQQMIGSFALSQSNPQTSS
ncbi:RNHCP domain-containing protein [Candidatus Pacebacteria bacterium]|nr:RNHCP domain-containing protein [Candidatus Paceibacterota bacterium]